MRILGIHYFCPPVAVVASRRLSGIYAEWSKRATSIDLITGKGHEERAKEETYRLNVPIHCVEEGGIRKLLAGNRTSISGSKKRQPGFQSLNRLRQSFPFLRWLDEGGPSYYHHAIERGSQLIRQKKITHLFSSYRPWVDHRIAAELKRRFPELYWIADFRDLPVDPARKDVFLPGFQSSQARKIVARANEVWAVSEGQAERLPAEPDRRRVVYNGLNALPKASWPDQATDFTISYTGSFYPGLQNGRPLRQALETLLAAEHPATLKTPKIQLQYAGKDAASFQKNWTRHQGWKLLNRGRISREQALALQQAATTNLLLSWSGDNYYGVLTAKLFEYLEAGRPITALVSGPDDPELRRIIEGSGAGRVFCNGQQAELNEWIERLYTNWANQRGKLNWETKAEVLRPLLRSEQLKTYLRGD